METLSIFEDNSLNQTLASVSRLNHGACQSDYYLAKQTAVVLASIIKENETVNAEKLCDFRQQFVACCETIIANEGLFRRTDGQYASEISLADEQAHHAAVKNMLALHRLRWEMLGIIFTRHGLMNWRPQEIEILRNKISNLNARLDARSSIDFRREYQHLIHEMGDNLDRLHLAPTDQERFKLQKELAWRFYLQYSMIEIENKSMSIRYYPEVRRAQQKLELEEDYDRALRRMETQLRIRSYQELEISRPSSSCGLWPLLALTPVGLLVGAFLDD